MPFWRIFQAQLLQDRVDLLLSEMELAEFTPNSLLLDDVIHERPGFGSRLQVFVVAHLKNDLPDAFFRQFREVGMYSLQLFQVNWLPGANNFKPTVFGWTSIWLAMFWMRSMVWRWAIQRFWLPRGFPQHFWFSCSTSCLSWSTNPRRVLICCLLSLTWIATSSIIWRRILWAPPDRLVMTASPDTISFRRAQMYWNRRWFRTEERKSRRWTASPSPLNPAISRVQRRTIWQWGGTTSGSPSVAFLNPKKIVLLIDFFSSFIFSFPGSMFFHIFNCTTRFLTSSTHTPAPWASPNCQHPSSPIPRHWSASPWR